MSGLPVKAVERAQMLAGIVHGDGELREVEAILCPLDHVDLYAVCVALAAMVDVDKSVSELLSWYQPTRRRHERNGRLAPHGTHAAFTRHKIRREEPCWDCVEAERAYQRNRKRPGRLKAVS